jgi:type I restriction-modification system DNA methylase subunit
VFLERCLQLCEAGGTAIVVLPQNWLFLTSYRKFREQLLKRDQWHLIARLGPGAFETISGEVVKAILITISRGNASGSNQCSVFSKIKLTTAL